MLSLLWQWHKPYLGWLALGVLLSLLTILANIGLLALSGWFIAAMALAGVAGTSINYFSPAAIIRGLSMVRTAGRYGERLVTHEATLRVIERLRVDFYQSLEPLAPAALGNFRGGDLLSRLQKDIDRLDAFYLRVGLPVIVAGIGVLLVFAVMALHSLSIAATSLAFLLIAGGLLPWLSLRASRAPGQKMVALHNQLRSQVLDQVQGMAELTAYGATERYRQAALDTQQQLQEAQAKLNQSNRLALASQQLLAHFAMWSVLLLAIPLLVHAQLPPPNLAMLALLALASFELVAPLPNAFAVIPETAAAAKRVMALMQEDQPTSSATHTEPVPSNGSLCFQQVSLRYRDTDKAAIHKLDLTLEAGSSTLLLGPSGAGKTSVVNLLMRFWEPTEGNITFAGHDLRSFDPSAWRERVALVSQHTDLLNGTLRDNLLLADPQAEDARLLEVCEQAQLGDFIASLPEGLDTWLGDSGARLSGGQARRVSIARALLKPAPLLLLDEPTEGLDRATERELMTALQQLMEGRTVLLISHRPLALQGFTQVQLDN